MKKKDKIENFLKALKRLDEAVKIAKSEIEIDGVIQRFEFTFELAWKAIKAYLESEGIITNTPKSCLKEAYSIGLIHEEKIWLNMLDDRNISVHTYNEIETRNIYERIKYYYLIEFNILGEKLKSKLYDN